MDKSLVSLTFTFIEQKSLRHDDIIDRIEKYINTIQLRDLKTSIDVKCMYEHNEICLACIICEETLQTTSMETWKQDSDAFCSIVDPLSQQNLISMA